jgi:hypothetical protein
MSAHIERCHLFAITNLLIETERPIAIILSHAIRDREAPGIARLMAERSLMKRFQFAAIESTMSQSTLAEWGSAVARALSRDKVRPSQA